jgi:DNA-3-methyladenine glycosylase
MDNYYHFLPDFQKALPPNFYLKDTEIIAKELIGKVLVKHNNHEILAGRIVETEAYLSENDLASHSAPGKTQRNSPMFAQGGILYVYMIYGVHHCINVVTGREGIGEAVLIRAIEPVLGIESMTINRNGAKLEALCKGPGNLAKAFGFTRQDNNSSLLTPKLYIQNSDYPKPEISVSKRIGIVKSAELQLRFYQKDSPFVSGKNK